MPPRAFRNRPPAPLSHAMDDATRANGAPVPGETPDDLEVASGVRLSPYLVALGPQAVAQVVDRYLTNVEDMEREMRRAVEVGDPEALERAAHSLKGSSGTIGAGRLREICRRLEEVAERGSVDGVEDGLCELRREFRQVSRQLSQHTGERE